MEKSWAFIFAFLVLTQPAVLLAREAQTRSYGTLDLEQSSPAHSTKKDSTQSGFASSSFSGRHSPTSVSRPHPTSRSSRSSRSGSSERTLRGSRRKLADLSEAAISDEKRSFIESRAKEMMANVEVYVKTTDVQNLKNGLAQYARKSQTKLSAEDIDEVTDDLRVAALSPKGLFQDVLGVSIEELTSYKMMMSIFRGVISEHGLLNEVIDVAMITAGGWFPYSKAQRRSNTTDSSFHRCHTPLRRAHSFLQMPGSTDGDDESYIPMKNLQIPGSTDGDDESYIPRENRGRIRRWLQRLREPGCTGVRVCLAATVGMFLFLLGVVIFLTVFRDYWGPVADPGTSPDTRLSTSSPTPLPCEEQCEKTIRGISSCFWEAQGHNFSAANCGTAIINAWRAVGRHSTHYKDPVLGNALVFLRYLRLDPDCFGFDWIPGFPPPDP